MHKTCAVEECNSPVRLKQYCFKHYNHYLVHGDPVADKGDGKKRAQEYKYCARCGLAKSRANYYSHTRGTNMVAYCIPCHKLITGGNHRKVRLANPSKGRQPRPVVQCAGPECEKQGKSRALGTDVEGMLCGAHWAQAKRNNSLEPIRPLAKPYVDDRFRQCIGCSEVKPHEDYYKATGNRKQTKCKVCMGQTTKFNVLSRQGDHQGALSVAETMGEPMKNKYVALAANAIKEALEQAHGQ